MRVPNLAIGLIFRSFYISASVDRRHRIWCRRTVAGLALLEERKAKLARLVHRAVFSINSMSIIQAERTLRLKARLGEHARLLS